MAGAGFPRANARRAVARKLALQSLYSWQINAVPWQDLLAEALTGEDAGGADQAYLQQMLQTICSDAAALDADIASFGEAPANGVDPVERAALFIGLYELRHQPELPFRVVISQSVNLATRFGATDGHKFVNVVLDRAARELRPHET